MSDYKVLNDNGEERTLGELYEDNVMLHQENDQLKEKIEYLKNKCENKDKWCQLIADIGFDYDGFTTAPSLMTLVDELVKYAIWARDNYDYDTFQKEGNNE